VGDSSNENRQKATTPDCNCRNEIRAKRVTNAFLKTNPCSVCKDFLFAPFLMLLNILQINTFGILTIRR
jgi:hypothetical protein